MSMESEVLSNWRSINLKILTIVSYLINRTGVPIYNALSSINHWSNADQLQLITIIFFKDNCINSNFRSDPDWTDQSDDFNMNMLRRLKDLKAMPYSLLDFIVIHSRLIRH